MLAIAQPQLVQQDEIFLGVKVHWCELVFTQEYMGGICFFIVWTQRDQNLTKEAPWFLLH